MAPGGTLPTPGVAAHAAGIGWLAAAMGQSVQTHLAAYSCGCGDEVVDDAFAKAEQRLLAS